MERSSSGDELDDLTTPEAMAVMTLRAMMLIREVAPETRARWEHETLQVLRRHAPEPVGQRFRGDRDQ